METSKDVEILKKSLSCSIPQLHTKVLYRSVKETHKSSILFVDPATHSSWSVPKGMESPLQEEHSSLKDYSNNCKTRSRYCKSSTGRTSTLMTRRASLVE